MLEFCKMSGSGNDFILIDNRAGGLEAFDLPSLARRLCRRGLSVGADGMILLENCDRADFQWRFYNADGSEAAMCGNGGRCAARFAYLKGIASASMSFLTGAGIIDAVVSGKRVKIRLTDPRVDFPVEDLEAGGRTLKLYHLNTGVPHAVSFRQDLSQVKVSDLGREIRYHARFQPAGTNVNFAQVLNRHTLAVRTYERGVEEETLACGTGATAAALIAAELDLVEAPVAVKVKSGETLNIYFHSEDGHFREVYLEGEADLVFEGRLFDEAYK
jgi:diaminopimelate epimerase